MKIFNSVIEAYQYYKRTGEDCAAVYPYDRRALYLNTTKRSHQVVLYRDGKDTRFLVDRIGR